ncbi:hypothetical protein WP50_15715 [Lactiplantibacillus plantarum]|nr:hypothetical protein WP50_15715 [Lactiplantibacillus plantarum]
MDLKQSDGWRYLAGWSFILLMVASATLQHDAEIILPEIGALTAGTWVYRKTALTRQHLKLFLVPSGTSIIGFLKIILKTVDVFSGLFEETIVFMVQC